MWLLFVCVVSVAAHESPNFVLFLTDDQDVLLDGMVCKDMVSIYIGIAFVEADGEDFGFNCKKGSLLQQHGKRYKKDSCCWLFMTMIIFLHLLHLK